MKQNFKIEIGDQFKLLVGWVTVTEVGDHVCRVKWKSLDGELFYALYPTEKLTRHERAYSQDVSKVSAIRN